MECECPASEIASSAAARIGGLFGGEGVGSQDPQPPGDPAAGKRIVGIKSTYARSKYSSC